MRASPRRALVACALLLSCLLPVAAAHATVVFSTDFSSGVPPEFSAPGASVAPVQGFSGLGPVGRQFNGDFLRYSAIAIQPTTLTLRGLPPHDRLSVRFLLAIIDSWDGTELMQIDVDGVRRFSNWFEIATQDTTSYTPAPAGSILAMSRELGYSAGSYYSRDRAYDLGVDPAFLDIPHTADSVVVVWSLGAISGGAAQQWQGGGDESWAIDAVSVEVTSSTAGVGGPGPDRELKLGVSPNPARQRELTFQLAVPRSDAATRLELMDLAGRVVERRDLGALGAGRHSVSLSPAASLVPGLYLARVQQGAFVRTTRVVVLAH